MFMSLYGLSKKEGIVRGFLGGVDNSFLSGFFSQNVRIQGKNASKVEYLARIFNAVVADLGKKDTKNELSTRPYVQAAF
ncbi:hypothetical protein QG034_08015 [Kingella kingae]|uniref:hypothetical protein n=1 Tax=Kingella kingae TaxID=504 RepID=UPI00050A1515|nr:hypothetical protein [Kingella kingae]MDK4526845.1 hypothetical protein [Kingella kingae]MDK4532886.1 hypothetical protein [Kingella kingae]